MNQKAQAPPHTVNKRAKGANNVDFNSSTSIGDGTSNLGAGGLGALITTSGIKKG